MGLKSPLTLIILSMSLFMSLRCGKEASLPQNLSGFTTKFELKPNSFGITQAKSSLTTAYITSSREQWIRDGITPTNIGQESMMRHDIYSLSRGKLLSFTFRKLKRTRSTCSYYPNCCATRQILLLGGDISTNPGPNVKRKPKCEQCERTIAKNSRSIKCVECECIKHLKCAGLTTKSFDRLETGWKCTKYILKELPLFDATISPGVNEIPDNTIVSRGRLVRKVSELQRAKQWSAL